jgi:hypothetical protein
VSELPAGLSLFLRDHVTSYEELETLLLLARMPEAAWTSSQIAEKLNVASVETVEAALDALRAGGQLVRGEPEARPKLFRFAPANDNLRGLVADLQRAYQDSRFEIVQTMTANAMQRVRSSAARRLADAFLFERRKK